jgi:hypothetical protein
MTYVPQEYPASRPGIQTLLVGTAVILLFVIVKFWGELTSLFGA